LCGLFRLFRDFDRAWSPVRLPPANQLQSALHLDLVLRVLDALAHLAVELAADLSLRSARLQPPWRVANLFEPDDRDGTGRPLARRRPRLFDVGAAARSAAGA